MKTVSEVASSTQVLYDSSTLEQLCWPKTYDGQYAKAYLMPLMQNGAKHYIDNIETTLLAAKVDDIVLPVTVNNAEYDNSHVCSPHTYFIGCGLATLEQMPNQWYKKPLINLLRALGWVLRSGQVNKVVCANNWLLPSNLYPKISKEQVHRIAGELLNRYPDHALMFRSVDCRKNADLFASLQTFGFDMLPSRKVYYVDTQEERSFRSRMFKSDLKLFKNSGYEVIDADRLTPQDLPQLVVLYRKLYLDKYLEYNPQLNCNFFSLALESKILSLRALRKNGQIRGVYGYFERNGVMVAPVFGYDTSIPQDTGLYRLISTAFALEAKEKGVLLNQSSGADSFKRLRRAEEVLDYTAVYTKHLPLKRRIPWNILRTGTQSIGLRVMTALKT